MSAIYKRDESKIFSRINVLRENMLDAVPSLSSERSVLATEFYKNNEGMPPKLLRAHLLEYLLAKKEVLIRDPELIAGNITKVLRAAEVFFPESDAAWIEDDIDNFPTRELDPFIVEPEVREEILACTPYWKGKCLTDYISKAVPEEELVAARNGATQINYADGTGHLLINYEYILGNGLEAVLKDIEKSRDTIDYYEMGALEKKMELDAMEIAVKAVIAYAHRFADLADERAAKMEAEDPTRAKELRMMAENLRTVPEHPAQTFWQALQSLWLCNLVVQIESNGTGVSIGRIDQWLYPYYRRDIDNKVITQDQAQELLDSLWLKFEEMNKIRSTAAVEIFSGYLTNQCVTIGGCDKNGADAVNDLSYMCLQAQLDVYLKSPQMAVRIGGRTPYKFLRKAFDCISLGGGNPELIGDDCIIQAMVRLGMSLPVARDYANVGCIEPSVVGGWGIHKGGSINLPKVADLALTNGVDRRTGEQVGCKSGDPAEFKTMDDYLEAVKAQIRFFVRMSTAVTGVVEGYRRDMIPHVFTSSVIPDCVDKRLDATAGGARYNWTGMNVNGGANFANGLAAVQKLVFDEKKYTIEQINEALDANFEGYEDMCYDMLQAPKYGNDEDYVDFLLRDGIAYLSDQYALYTNPRGGIFTIGFFPGTLHHYYGTLTGATADGRKAGEAFADAISPTSGSDKKGPTAVMSSVTKLDMTRSGNGSVLNMKFSPALFSTEQDVRNFLALNKSYLTMMGGFHVQYNIVSKETLQAAQADPKKYKDLIVRVTGYSAYFTELGKEVQDEIIERTEQEM